MCCHITCAGESSADALMDTWIVYLCCLLLQISCWHQSSLTTSQLTILDGCWSKGTVVGIQQSERWLDCCCKQGTGEASAVSASMCRLQWTPARTHVAFTCSCMETQTGGRILMLCTFAWLHFSCSNKRRETVSRVHTYIHMLYLYAKQLLPKHLHSYLCPHPRNRHTYRDAFKTLCHIVSFHFNSKCRK